jgi:hypothetical protein
MNDIYLYFIQTYEKQILHDYYCHIVVHGICDVNLNLIFCQFFLLLTTNFKQNQIMLICTSRVSKLKKNQELKKKITFFFFFGANSSSISHIIAMKCSISPSTQFFLVFFKKSSLFFNTTTFFLGVLFFGTCLGISYKSKSLSTCENWCFNLPLFAPPSNSPPFRALGKG